MNKTEKLLAARKKLKEFQQHKLNHNHNNSEVAQQLQDTQDTIAPAVPPEVVPQVPPVLQEPHPEPKPISPIESPKLPEIPTIPSIPSVPISSHDNHSPFAPLPPETSEDLPKNSIDQDHKDLGAHVFCDAFRHHTPDTDIFSQLPSQNGVDPGPSISLEGSPSLQKQHLLQMANEVANALTDTENCPSSPALTSDLEYRNQFLTTCLDEQKRLVSQLHVQVSQYSSRVSELEALLSTKDLEFEAKLIRELSPLKDQLKVHAQTTGILVGEKAELTSAITQYQTLSQQKSEEVEDLCQKLKASHAKTSELERELFHLKNATEEIRTNYHQLQAENSHLHSRFSELKKDKEEQQLESAELRQELNLKNSELSSLHRELSEKKNLLSLAELKIQQLGSPQEMQTLEGQHQAQKVLEQQLQQLRETLKSVNLEKDETSKHYENYVKQLDSRYDKLLEELEASKSKMVDVEKREESFIQRLSVMEQQYQREKQRVEALLPLEAHEEKIQHLTTAMDTLVLQQDTLQSTIREKDAEIESMREELNQLRELRDENVESLKLVSALEGEQLGASRAVSQNQELKAQLNEMHDAFVMLSNSKLDLTEKLQGERTIGRKLNAELNRVEDERDELREEIKRKDAVIDELEKDKLLSAQVRDQMQHYQSQYSQNRTLQDELQSSLRVLELLKKENQMLMGRLHALGDVEGAGDGIGEVVTGNSSSQSVEEKHYVQGSHENHAGHEYCDEHEHHDGHGHHDHHDGHQHHDHHDGHQHHDHHDHHDGHQNHDHHDGHQHHDHHDGHQHHDHHDGSDCHEHHNEQGYPDHHANQNILSEPLKKLQMRFKETMEKVAELTDEKQKLEHLVLQLQGETETIGEYITLYQKQRAILQRKANEKEQTFRVLMEQRNHMQVQLHQLKVLVAELLRSQTTGQNSVGHSGAPDTGTNPDYSTHAGEMKMEGSEHPKPEGPVIDLKNETTSKILDLLTEIKDCKDTCSLEPNFHPCLWCSGKLITV